MKSFTQYIQERNDLSFMHEDAVVMRLRDFIDALELLEARNTDEPQLVEIREDVPEPGTYALRLVPQVPE